MHHHGHSNLAQTSCYFGHDQGCWPLCCFCDPHWLCDGVIEYVFEHSSCKFANVRVAMSTVKDLVLELDDIIFETGG